MAVDFRIRDFCHPIAIYRLKRRFDRNQWLPLKTLEAEQRTRLTRILQHAFHNVPYYRRLFATLGLKSVDLEDPACMDRLPLLSRKELTTSLGTLIADNAKRYGPIPYTTSGTTGTPTRFYLDRSSNVLEFVYYWRHWSWAGYRLGDRFAELGTVFFLRRKSVSGSIGRWQPHLRRLMLNSGRLLPGRAADMAALIRRHRPKFLKGTASALYFFSLSLREACIDDIRFSAIFSTGEVLTPAFRSLIREVLGGPVLDSYGHMERTVAISECPEGGYHIHPDYGFTEFIEPRSSADGSSVRARIVGTSLYNLAMPLIRYDTGDDIELFLEPRHCPCGRTFPLVKAIHGRYEDTIVTPDGKYITALFILPELSRGARFIQFIQKTPTTLLVQVVPGDDWTKTEEHQLVDRVRDLTGADIALRVETVGDGDLVRDPSGKLRTVISRVSSD